MGIYEDAQRAHKQQEEISKSFFSGESTVDLVKRIETEIMKGKKAALGEVRMYSGVAWKKVSETGNPNKDWQRVKKGEEVKSEETKVEEKKDENFLGASLPNLEGNIIDLKLLSVQSGQAGIPMKVRVDLANKSVAIENKIKKKIESIGFEKVLSSLKSGQNSHQTLEYFTKHFAPLEKKDEVKDKEEKIDDLEEGFTDGQFEKFVYGHESDIKDNMKTYGITKLGLTKIHNYFDFANVLGVDTNAIKNIELPYYTKFLQGLLS